MQPPVKIIKSEKSFRVYFSYNSDLVELMKELDGWYMRSDKAWQFKLGLFTTVVDTLKKNLYTVDIKNKNSNDKSISTEVKQEKKYNYDGFKDNEVVSIFGKCKKCKLENFVNRNKLCATCNITQNQNK